MTDSENLMTGAKSQNLLTFDAWRELFNTLTDDQLHFYYDKIIQIPGVYDEFCGWEEATQRQIIRWIASTSNVKDISLIAHLRRQLTELYPEVHWNLAGMESVRSIAIRFKFAFDLQHDKLVDLLSRDARISSDGNTDYAIRAEINIVAAWLLSLLYGKARVGEVIQKFLSSNMEDYSIAQLGEIVERWDEFYEYPIEWAVNTLTE